MQKAPYLVPSQEDREVTDIPMGATVSTIPLFVFNSKMIAFDIQTNVDIGAGAGTAEGTVAIEGSLDHDPKGSEGNGTWTEIGLDPPLVAIVAGEDNQLVELPEVCVPYLRVTFTRTGGDGTMRVWNSMKGRV